MLLKEPTSFVKEKQPMLHTNTVFPGCITIWAMLKTVEQSPQNRDKELANIVLQSSSFYKNFQLFSAHKLWPDIFRAER